MQPKSPADYLVLSVRVLMGVWFILVGAEKAFRVGAVEFSRQVADFEILMDPWNLVVAYAVPWIEMVGGLGLLVSRGLRGSVRALIGLSLIFVFVSVQAWVRGLDVDCGCFGSFLNLDHGSRLALLALQIGMLTVVLVTERDMGRKVFGVRPMRLPGS